MARWGRGREICISLLLRLFHLLHPNSFLFPFAGEICEDFCEQSEQFIEECFFKRKICIMELQARFFKLFNELDAEKLGTRKDWTMFLLLFEDS
jgi:hypothetical protein